MSTSTETMTDSLSQNTRAERMRQPLAADVVAAVADQHGVCVRPFTMEVGDPDTGELRYVPLPCGSTVESVCGPCARKARALRMAQCREGWHLAEEPILEAEEPTAEQRAQLTARDSSTPRRPARRTWRRVRPCRRLRLPLPPPAPACRSQRP